MPFPKRQRTRYASKRRPRNNLGIPTRRTSPHNQMSNYMSKRDPFPAVEYVTLRYTTSTTLTPSANGFVGFHTFRASSIFDPDYKNLTSGGQPYGRDIYETIYNHYMVLGSTIAVQGMASNNQDFPGLGIALDDDHSFSSDRQKIMSAKGSTYSMLGTGGNNASAPLTRTYNHKMLPDASQLSSSMGDNSEQDFNFRVFTITDQTSRSVDCIVTIIYRVKMWGLKNLTT